MGAEENKAAVVDAIDAFNDVEARRRYLEIHDPSVTAHGLGSAEPVDFEGVTKFYEMLWGAFPDVEVTVEDLVAEGERLPSGSPLAARTEASSWGLRRAVTRSRSAFKTSTDSAAARWSSAGRIPTCSG